MSTRVDRDDPVLIGDYLHGHRLWNLRRGERRISLKVPVILEGKDRLGVHYIEQTLTENVSLQGLRVEMVHEVRIGMLVHLSDCKGRFQGLARVTAELTRKSKSGKFRVGLNFLQAVKHWVVR